MTNEFNVNKVEQNFEQYVFPHVNSRIRPDIADFENPWMSVFFCLDSHRIGIRTLIDHDV